MSEQGTNENNFQNKKLTTKVRRKSTNTISVLLYFIYCYDCELIKGVVEAF